MVRFIPLNITDEDSVEYVLSHVDNSMQYGEDLEPKVIYYFNILAYYTNTCSLRNLMMLKNMMNKKKKKITKGETPF